jgi:hypothetical protein
MSLDNAVVKAKRDAQLAKLSID